MIPGSDYCTIHPTSIEERDHLIQSLHFIDDQIGLQWLPGFLNGVKIIHRVVK